jgi:enoyl-CoA hydratase/carnithine racemase
MEPVRRHDVGQVRVLTLARPAARNAMSSALLAALLDALAEAVADGDVRVVVLTGEGGHFSAGADLREELDHPARVRRMELFGAVYQAVGTCPKPTIAAVSGACVGGGAEAAAACDLRVADRTARFRFPGAALGFPVGAAKLVGLVGLGNAKDLVLTARTVDAQEAQRLGLVQRLVGADPLAAAVRVGTDIAGNSAAAVAHLKRQFDRFSGLGDRIAAEADDAHALAEADGDFAALTMRNPRAGWSPG